MKDNLPGLPIGGKLLEPTLMVGSDPLTRFVPLKELFPFREDISPLQSVFLIRLEWSESNGLSNMFKSGMFDNISAQDELYPHFGVLVNRSTIYAAHKREMGQSSISWPKKCFM